MRHYLFWFLAFVNLAAFGVLSTGVAIGKIPTTPGFVLCLLALALVALSAWLADRHR